MELAKTEMARQITGAAHSLNGRHPGAWKVNIYCIAF